MIVSRCCFSFHPSQAQASLLTLIADIEYAVYFVAFLTLSYSIAFVLYLTVELPAAGLIGMLVPKK
jgi:hypothetical protein